MVTSVYYYCMPTKVKIGESVVHARERMRALVAWTELIPNLGLADIQSLIAFRKRYGREAMVRRAQSILQRRNLVSTEYLDKIKASTELLQSMNTLQMSTKQMGRLYSSKDRQRMRKRSELVHGFASRVEPMIRSILTLAFTTTVVERWLSRAEIESFTGVNDSPQNQITMRSLIEKRSGISVERQMRDIKRQVEHDFTEMWAANIKDGLILAKNPEKRREYEKIMQSDNLAELTNFYLKGIK